MENYTKINKMEDMRRAIKNIHKEASALSRMMYYRLDGNIVTHVDDVMEWSRWFAKANRIIKRDVIDSVIISTVFLGIDHNFGDSGPPILFKTIIFGDDDVEDHHYATYDEAVAGHERIVELTRRGGQ
mgnify:CR=1 FL=1